MPLSEAEQRLFDQIERQFHEPAASASIRVPVARPMSAASMRQQRNRALGKIGWPVVICLMVALSLVLAVSVVAVLIVLIVNFTDDAVMIVYESVARGLAILR
jgi:hypothetical protein